MKFNDLQKLWDNKEKLFEDLWDNKDEIINTSIEQLGTQARKIKSRVCDEVRINPEMTREDNYGQQPLYIFGSGALNYKQSFRIMNGQGKELYTAKYVKNVLHIMALNNRTVCKISRITDSGCSVEVKGNYIGYIRGTFRGLKHRYTMSYLPLEIIQGISGAYRFFYDDKEIGKTYLDILSEKNSFVFRGIDLEEDLIFLATIVGVCICINNEAIESLPKIEESSYSNDFSFRIWKKDKEYTKGKEEKSKKKSENKKRHDCYCDDIDYDYDD